MTPQWKDDPAPDAKPVGVLAPDQDTPVPDTSQAGTDEIPPDKTVPGVRTVGEIIREKLQVPSIDLSLYLIEEDVARSVPERIARKYNLIPVFRINNNLTVAMSDPMDVLATDEVQAATGCRIEPVRAGESEIDKTIDQYFGAKKAGGASGGASAPPDSAGSTGLVNSIITRAVKEGASDIHIEPEDEYVRVRQRIDGILTEVMVLPKATEAALVNRVKILSKLDISEKRLPQDGRIQLNAAGKDIDIRVSVQPTVAGENVVMRILDRSSVLLDLEKLGLDHKQLGMLHDAIRKPYGMVLVTGPTGSGKTTTLYSILNEISSPDINIMTIEDPVEYRLEGIRQTQVNKTAGYTFANGLRALLRQDPDVMMVGEIRDLETAEIAVRAALTGHMVFSTLHTNDASGAFTRLIDMGVEPFLVASSIHCVVAQRLVRLIHDKCRRPGEPSEYLLKRLGIQDRSHEFFRGKGCRTCQNTGYKGRCGIFEVLAMSQPVRTAILERSSTETLRDAARGQGMRNLRECGMAQAFEGKTTLDEVLSATSAEDDLGGGRNEG